MDRRASGRVGVAVALCVLLLVLVATGCSPAAPAPSGPAAPGPGPSTAPTSSGAFASGVVEHSDGSVEATGYVGFSDLEGGFWALYDRAAGASPATQPKILLVLLPGKVAENAIAALKGARVRVTGRLQTGVSTRQAGPEVLVDTIAGVRNDAPK